MKKENKFELEELSAVEMEQAVDIKEEEMKSIAGGTYYTDRRPWSGPCNWEQAH